jgi:DNA-binding CsgD family transcriptional regulator/PAS domain-containing protein
VEDELGRLALSLYQAALDNQGWNETLAQVARSFRADMAMLMVIDSVAGRPRRADMLSAHNIAPDALAEYGDRIAALDPWVRYGVRDMPLMVPRRLDQVLPAETFVNTPPFRHFAQHGAPARHALAGRFAAEGDGVSGAISLLRYGSSGAFAEASEPVLEALLPHIQRAAVAHARLHGPGIVMAHAVEALGQAVAVLDAEARPLAMNAEFRALLHGGWFVYRHAAMLPAGNEAAQRFATIVAATATGAAGAVPGGEVVLRHPERHAVLVARILPHARPRSAALVVIHDPAHATPPSPDTLREALGLTRAEAALAAALAEGESVAHHAARRGVSLATVKTQLAALFGKTGTVRQAELVALLLRMAR